MNKYLNWIDDESLIEAISHVYLSFKGAFSNLDLKELNRNVVDPFLHIFDMKLVEGKTIETWVEAEMKRKIQKTFNNSIGDFHQKVLGNAYGWRDLGHNHETGLDVCSRDESIFAEIKNRKGTITGANLNSVFNKLQATVERRESSTAYLVEILSKSKKSYNCPWEFTAKSQRYSHPRVFIISGDLFYEQVAGPNALCDLFRMLPIAISDFLVEHPKVVESEIEAIKQVLEIQDKSSRDDEFSFSYFFKQAYPKLDRES